MTAPPSPPDLLRPPLPHPARALAGELAEHAPRWMWRSLHLLDRERFDEGGAPPALERVEVTTRDGWTLPIGVAPPGPGGSGEPVLLLHTLGLGPDSFRYGRAGTLAQHLRHAGFSCWFAAVRGDREAVAAQGAPGPGFEGVVEEDLPRIVEAVRRHSGADRVLVVGHGLGALAALAWAAAHAGEGLAGLASLSAPVRFPGFGRVGRVARAGMRLAARLPLSMPVRRLARLAAVCVPAQRPRPLVTPPGPRLRGGLVHAAEDVPVGLLDQLCTWCEAGALVDGAGVREYGAALAKVDAPLLVVSAAGDGWCPPERALPLLELWGGEATHVQASPTLGHLDLVLHPEAGRTVFRPLTAWLDARRRRCWPASLLVG